jgi:hypothetical protein
MMMLPLCCQDKRYPTLAEGDELAILHKKTFDCDYFDKVENS